MKALKKILILLLPPIVSLGQPKIDGTYIQVTTPYYYQSDITEVLNINPEGGFKYFHIQPVYTDFTYSFTLIKYGEGEMSINGDSVKLMFKKVFDAKYPKVSLKKGPGDSTYFKVKAYPMGMQDSTYQHTLLGVVVKSNGKIKTSRFIESVNQINFRTTRPSMIDTLLITEIGTHPVEIPITNDCSEVTLTAYLSCPLYIDSNHTINLRHNSKGLLSQQGIFKKKSTSIAKKIVTKWCGKELSKKL